MSTTRPLAALPALVIRLAACSGAASSADADLRVAVAQLRSSTEQLHLDPYAGSVLFHTVDGTLLECDDREQRLRGMVATRSAYLDDLTLELTIRDDVRLHDGTELATELLALDECGTRLLPVTSPSPLLTYRILWSMDVIGMPSPFDEDDVADPTPVDGVDLRQP